MFLRMWITFSRKQTVEEENIDSANVSVEGKLKVTLIAARFELVKFIPGFMQMSLKRLFAQNKPLFRTQYSRTH
jgi:hypothetical protein